MALTREAMTDEQRKSVAIEYLKAFDNGGVTSGGGSILDLFADDAHVYFPKCGLAGAGAVAPGGRVYFAESTERQAAKGTVRLAVISSANGGTSWTTTYVARSQQQPPCLVKGCPNDFYGRRSRWPSTAPEPSLPPTSQIPRPGAPMRLYAITSAAGVCWSAR